MANFGLGRAVNAAPSASTTLLSHRKLRYDAAAPSRYASAHRQPRQIRQTKPPAAASTTVPRVMRRSAVSKSLSSGTIFVIPHEQPYQLYEACGDTQKQ